jgi:hypothetical protein
VCVPVCYVRAARRKSECDGSSSLVVVAHDGSGGACGSSSGGKCELALRHRFGAAAAAGLRRLLGAWPGRAAAGSG